MRDRERIYMRKAGREKGGCNKERKVDMLCRLRVLSFNG